MNKAFLAMIAALLFVAPLAGAIYLGTAEGYVLFVNGTPISGASVLVQVQSCSGTGCSDNTTTQSNGYYVLANLNSNPGATVTVTASRAGASGSSSGTADAFQAAFVNITICQPPNPPAINATTTSIHNNTNVNFSWTNRTDPNGLNTSDEFTLDSAVYYPATSPKNFATLSYANHSWSVRTCNSYCCSASNSSTLNVGNTAPSTPNLTLVNFTSTSPTTLAWTSGADPEGDSTYDQLVFNSNQTNATSPQSRTVTFPTYNTWSVRTCDTLGACSAYATEYFIAAQAGAGVCPNCPPPSGPAGRETTALPACPRPTLTTPAPTPLPAPAPQTIINLPGEKIRLMITILERTTEQIKILITDEQARRVADATVSLVQETGSITEAQTNERGEATLRGFEAGTATLLATKPGYIAQQQRLQITKPELRAAPAALCTYNVLGTALPCDWLALATAAIVLLAIAFAIRTLRPPSQKPLPVKTITEWKISNSTIMLLLTVQIAASLVFAIAALGKSATSTAAVASLTPAQIGAPALALTGLFIAILLFAAFIRHLQKKNARPERNNS